MVHRASCIILNILLYLIIILFNINSLSLFISYMCINALLQIQLRHERTEERRKLFKIAEKRHAVAETPLSRWKKILPALPQARMSRNSEAAQRDNVQIAIENVNGTAENKRLTNDIEKDSPQERMSDCDNEQRAEEQNDFVINDVSSNRRYDNNNDNNKLRKILWQIFLCK